MPTELQRLTDFPDGMYPDEHPYSEKNDPEHSKLLQGITARLPALKDSIFNMLSVVNPSLEELKPLKGSETDRVNCILGLLKRFFAMKDRGTLSDLAQGGKRISDFQILASVRDAEELRNTDSFVYDALILMIDDNFAVPKGMMSTRDSLAQIVESNGSADGAGSADTENVSAEA